MGVSKKIRAVHFTAREVNGVAVNALPGLNPTYITVGDSLDGNPRCQGVETLADVVVTDSGWYDCEPALTGQYLSLVNTNNVPLEVVEMNAYSDLYITHRADPVTSTESSLVFPVSNVMKNNPQPLLESRTPSGVGFAHTDTTTAVSWFRFDLRGPMKINSIVIMGRTEFRTQCNKSKVYIGDDITSYDAVAN